MQFPGESLCSHPLNISFLCGVHQTTVWFFLITKERKKHPKRQIKNFYHETIDLVFGLIILGKRENPILLVNNGPVVIIISLRELKEKLKTSEEVKTFEDCFEDLVYRTH